VAATNLFVPTCLNHKQMFVFGEFPFTSSILKRLRAAFLTPHEWDSSRYRKPYQSGSVVVVIWRLELLPQIRKVIG
jgi:hypothetical protein